jgi:hypothetical protein
MSPQEELRIPDETELGAMTPAALRSLRTRLRNEIAFAWSQERCGGPRRDEMRTRWAEAIDSINHRLAALAEDHDGAGIRDS